MLDKHAEQSSNTRASRASGLVYNCIAWPWVAHPSFVDRYEIFTTHSHVSDKGFDVVPCIAIHAQSCIVTEPLSVASNLQFSTRLLGHLFCSLPPA